MPITINDRRQPRAAFGLTAGATDVATRNDEVMVQPLTTYMEGREHKNERSAPYAVPRHVAAELEGHGFARVIETPADDPVGGDDADETADDESEVEQPDDESDSAESSSTEQPVRRGRGRPRKPV